MIDSSPTMKKLNNTSMDESTSSPFYYLTEEIVSAILDHLKDDSLTLKSFSFTCKSFHLFESHHRKSLRPLRSDFTSKIIHRYPSISNLDFSLCPQVEDSTLTSISLAWKSTLRSINLSRSRFFTAKGLSSLVSNCSGLVEIDLSNGTSLTDSALKVIAEAKNLEKLWLARCKSITDMGIGCISVGCRKLKLISLKWCLGISDLGVGLIAMKCKELQSLDLSYLPITEKCLTPILQLQHLEDLVLEGCMGINDDRISSLQHSCASLKTLNLCRCQNISHVGLSSLIKGAEYLEQLDLSHGFTVSADMANCLQNFSRLQSVKLYGCSITSSGARALANWKTSLEELSVSKCSGLTDEFLSGVVQPHKGLRKLDISCCHKITYASIETIANSCTTLTSLRMESCSSVSRDAFLLIGQQCFSLEELDVTENEIDDEGLKSISRCSRLSSLKLGICLSITDDGIIHIGNNCLKLTELDLYRSTGITDIGIAAIAQGCPSLEIVNLSYNDKLTDSSLVSLSKCSRLRELELRQCSRVTSVGLSAIAMRCNQLQVLNIKKCLNIDDNGMHLLAQFCHNLRQINISHCSVTEVGLLSLARINCLQSLCILHTDSLTPSGLAAALWACEGLRKVKLHTSFKLLLPPSIQELMESRGCVFRWRVQEF